MDRPDEAIGWLNNHIRKWGFDEVHFTVQLQQYITHLESERDRLQERVRGLETIFQPETKPVGRTPPVEED